MDRVLSSLVIKKLIKFFSAGLLGALLLAASASAQNVTVSWAASSSPAAVTYKVYYGTVSRAYSGALLAGAATSLRLTGLVPGKTYFCAITSRDASGRESAFSTEVMFTVAQPASSTSSSSTPTASSSAAFPVTTTVATTSTPKTVSSTASSSSSSTTSSSSSTTSSSSSAASSSQVAAKTRNANSNQSSAATETPTSEQQPNSKDTTMDELNLAADPEFFTTMLPFDLNRDGRLDGNEIDAIVHTLPGSTFNSDVAALGRSYAVAYTAWAAIAFDEELSSSTDKFMPNDLSADNHRCRSDSSQW